MILPLAILVLCGLIDFGFMFQGYSTLRNGVEAGARLASQDAGGTLAYTGTASCTAGPGGPTTQLLCAILAGIGSVTGTQSGTLKLGIAVKPATVPNPQTTGQDVTVCASSNLNSTTGLLAKAIMGETMTSSSSILISGPSGTTVMFGQYDSTSTAVVYNGVAVDGIAC